MIITNPQEFVNKWRGASLKERAAAQEHFIDLCRLVGHRTPAEMDPTGESFTFEAGVNKTGGGKGWADVWKKGCFGWEYKGKHANLNKAYQQLLQYRESLQNPPLLVVCDLDTIVIHTNFTNTIKQTVTLTLDDLLTPQGYAHLKNVFYEPNAFRATTTTEQVTQQAAEELARLSAMLREAGHETGHESEQIAHFLIRVLFCLFAEDIGLLPKDLFTRLISLAHRNMGRFSAQLAQLFGAMATGGFFGVDDIRHFNGGLFDNEQVLTLPHEAVSTLERIAKLDWSNVEPSILGTLFERSLNPAKRSQLGAHYTSREDILLIVEPVLMTPLRRRWVEVQAEAHKLVTRRNEAKTERTRRARQADLEQLLQAFSQELAAVRVLDPACGSGNFLYVALKQLLDLWKEVSVFSGEQQLTLMLPLPEVSPSPAQLFGIEINPYAYELAQATVWIGYIQWLHENGFGLPAEPILKPLNNIHNMDAILAYDADGNPVEPKWPEADVIIGNPPFLGARKMRTELGDKYFDDLLM
ncbi:MAG: DNA methyltransferase, partial [Chloroflexota bacterium]